MAWQYPEHICGHKGERYQAYGKRDGRERELNRIESQPCPECRKKAAEEMAIKLNLPLLTGSPKQIAWASEIRERALRLLPVEQMEKIRPETSAKWWIENRNSLGTPAIYAWDGQ